MGTEKEEEVRNTISSVVENDEQPMDRPKILLRWVIDWPIKECLVRNYSKPLIFMGLVYMVGPNSPT